MYNEELVQRAERFIPIHVPLFLQTAAAVSAYPGKNTGNINLFGSHLLLLLQPGTGTPGPLTNEQTPASQMSSPVQELQPSR